MAHGLDRVYPPSHAGLADRIVEGGGALVSEYPPGAPPHRRTFVARNRIQTGLSAGVVVVETAARGGTMETARFASEQGRPLACVARPGGAPALAEGNDMLVGSGAAVALDSPASVNAFLSGLGAAEGQNGAGHGRSRPSQGDLF
jgi:DNA processing protein